VSLVWFLVGIPASIEIIAGVLGCRDLVRHPGQRTRAVEQLIRPMLLAGVVLWIVPPPHWLSLAAALTFVIAWQIAAAFLMRHVLSRPGFGAGNLDTQGDD
jgi:hypothetical protein